MKKWIAGILCLCLLMALPACSDTETAETETPVQLANPYLTFETAGEMQESAGLEIRLPGVLPDWVTETVYRAIPRELVEVIYLGGDNELRVRIAEGSRDISGVYDADTREEKDVPLGENTVHVKGETQPSGEFLVYVTTWNTGEGRTYSVTSTQGVPETELWTILEAIR